MRLISSRHLATRSTTTAATRGAQLIHESRATAAAAMAAARTASQLQEQQAPVPARMARPARVPKRWHALDNSAVRSHIVAKLRKLFPALERARLSDAAPSPATTATVVQRLEWMLYHAAHSRREYANECSLERRVQALVTQQLTTQTAAAAAAARTSPPSPCTRKPAAAAAVAAPSAPTPSCPRTSCAKRPRRASLSALTIDDASSLHSEHRASYKRRRRESFHTLARSMEPLAHVAAAAAAPVAVATRHCDLAPRPHASSTLFLNNDVDLVAQVFQYVDGHEVVRARAVNRFLAAHALEMVRSLTLDVRALCHSSPGAVTALLQRCPRVRRLVVTNTRKPSPLDLPRGYSAPKGPEPLLQCGSEVVAQATAAFHGDACPLLEALELRAPFEFATESDAIVACLEALARRDARWRRNAKTRQRAPLTRLVLDATFLGDARTEQLAQLMTSAPRYFQDLETVVLRGNFVGEAGASALFAALRGCRQLQDLDLSSNILTDTDAVALADAMAPRRPRREDRSSSSATAPFGALERLGLHENFIGLDGFAALSSAMCSRLLALSDDDAMPARRRKRLVHVACAHNCAPLAHAARLFAF